MSLQTQLAGKALKSLLAIEDQRTQQLNRIERKVQAGLERPYHAGRLILEEANAPDIGAARRAERLVRAEDAFIDAYGALHEVDPSIAAWSAVHVVGISLLQERSSDARRWAEKTHLAAIKAVRERCTASNDRIDSKLGKLRITSAELTDGGVAGMMTYAIGITFVGFAALPAVPAAVAGAVGIKKYRQYRADRAEAGLTEVAKFADEVAAIRRSLGDTNVVEHSLSSDRDNRWSYKEKQPQPVIAGR
jgi:hypothetical protein